ncbi:MAG: divergent polysaccharide deacetylase family protein [Gammaproteobacteria bacterium]|nr:MAG: divergent polysaccharide deacetylase family protein [Gammaproteobacteria bacterium]
MKPRAWRWRRLGHLLWLCTFLAGSARAEAPPRIAILIDDLGRVLDAGRAVIDLPGPVACAFLPYAPHTATLAREAHAAGKEVLLHLPMQSAAERPLDRGGLTLDMTRTALLHTLADDLARVPYAVGVNNHMGSLLTRHPGHMTWLMQELHRRGLFFIDSRTTPFTVARRMAFEQHLPSRRRDVFLDPAPGAAEVEREFHRLLALARRRGSALAIGHPRPETIRILARELPRLQAEGIRLVPVGVLVQQQYARDQQWRLSSSPWPRVAKNSRPSPSSTCCGVPASR